jgi:lipoyl(octanoyl) transferase
MTWYLLNSGKGDPAFNMALDEALLENAARIGAPVLRFYGWTEPAATFGYFQKYAEVAAVTHLRPLIRRPTGGGLVPHVADWTYSFIVPPDHAWHAVSAEESYRRIHDWLRRAFAEIKIKTELAPCCKKKLPGQCFIGYEKFDLLWRGKKIAGAAQRRNKLGLLIQGSVQPPPLPARREDFESAMQRAAGGNFDIGWESLPWPSAADDTAKKLDLLKYSNYCYNLNR